MAYLSVQLISASKVSVDQWLMGNITFVCLIFKFITRDCLTVYLVMSEFPYTSPLYKKSERAT